MASSLRGSTAHAQLTSSRLGAKSPMMDLGSDGTEVEVVGLLDPLPLAVGPLLPMMGSSTQPSECLGPCYGDQSSHRLLVGPDSGTCLSTAVSTPSPTISMPLQSQWLLGCLGWFSLPFGRGSQDCRSSSRHFGAVGTTVVMDW